MVVAASKIDLYQDGLVPRPVCKTAGVGYLILNSPGPYSAYVHRVADRSWEVTDGWGVTWPKTYKTRRLAAWHVMVNEDAPFGDPTPLPAGIHGDVR